MEYPKTINKQKYWLLESKAAKLINFSFISKTITFALQFLLYRVILNEPFV